MKLRDYQERISTQAAEILNLSKCCYLSMECRTGKTITALSAAVKFGATNVLFVTKKNAMADATRDVAELQKETPSMRVRVINYESVHHAAGAYDFAILDEAHTLGAYPRPSERTKVVREVCKGLPILYSSGTPSPESYSQLYHQFWVSSYSPFQEFSNFYKWAKRFVYVHTKKVNGFFINDYSSADKAKIDEYVGKLFISYTQEEAGFKSEIEEQTLQVPMSATTIHYLSEIRKHRVAQINGGMVVADNPAKLLIKMHQISSGTCITEDGEHIVFDKSKAMFIKEYFEGKKIAIFYVYKSEFDLLTSIFPDYTTSPIVFQQSSDKVYIAQVRSSREGVRLDTADALIFYNLEFSYLSYEQGRNRLISKEREEPARVYFLVSDCGIERLILNAVHSKVDFTMSYYGKNQKLL